MILDNLFKPRWQHADVQIRRQALDGLGDHEALGQIARQDPEPELRIRALERLIDPLILDLAARTDTEPSVRTYAANRLRAILTGADPGALTLTERLVWINRFDDPELLAYLARHGGEPTLRSSVLERIKDDEILAASAVADPDARVRALAAGRLHSRTILERVAKLVRNRDKGVHRIVQERITALRAAEQLPQKQRALRRELCADAEALVKRGQWRDAATPLERLEERWANAEGTPDPDLAARFATAGEKIRTGIAEYHNRNPQNGDNSVTLRATKESLCLAMENIVTDLAQRDHLEDSDATTAHSLVRTLENSWNETPALPEAEEVAFRNRFYTAQQQIGLRLGVLLERVEHRAALRAITERAVQALAGNKLPNEETINKWQQEWQALGVKLEEPQEQEISQRFHATIEQLREKIQKNQEQIRENRSKVEIALIDLEAAVETGTLKTAAPALTAAQEALGALPTHLHGEFKPRLENCAAAVHKLQEWQNWAQQRERERLCQEVESLIGLEDAPEQIANRIKALREAWNNLNPSKREGGLNGRFNAGCTAAFEPCRVYFAEQSRRREAANAIREQLITKVEEFVRTAGDWTATDWRAADKFLQETREAWRNIGPIDRRTAGRLQERFNAALVPLQRALRQEQRRNLKLKEELVIRAEAIQKDQSDPRSAVTEIKNLQNSWKNLGIAPRHQEQNLWKRMRTVADAVFEQRQAQVRAQEAERTAARAARTAICEQIEALAQRPGAELFNATGELAALEQQWANLSTENSPSLENRLRKAIAAYHAAVVAQRRRAAWSGVENLINQGNLCAELESRLEKDADLNEILPEIQERWNILAATASPPPKIAQRFAQAITRAALPLERNPPPFSADARDEIERLCVRLEVLAGVESPPEAARTRLALQVHRLAQGFSQRREVPTLSPEQRKAQFIDLLHAWYALGPIPHELHNSLEERLGRVLTAIKNTDY